MSRSDRLSPMYRAAREMLVILRLVANLLPCTAVAHILITVEKGHRDIFGTN